MTGWCGASCAGCRATNAEAGCKLTMQSPPSGYATFTRRPSASRCTPVSLPAPNTCAYLGAVSLDALISDGRNSQIVCELGHRQIELGRFAPAPSPHLIAFATEYGLAHLLEPASTERREAA